MCNHCSIDPRDRISQAERALFGLRELINQIQPGEAVSADGVGGIVNLIHEHLAVAEVQIQDYLPRSHI